MRKLKLVLVIGFFAAVLTPALLVPLRSQEKQIREPDVIFVPTPHEVVDKMLELADVRPGEIVYDLGCGDGRIPVAAAKKFGVKAWGFDINPVRVKESLETVAKNNVKHLVTIKQADVFELDLSKADVITLYLLPQLNVKLIPQLDKLKPGCRIVSHDFNMEGVRPKKEITFTPQGSREHRIYLWVTPLEKERKTFTDSSVRNRTYTPSVKQENQQMRFGRWRGGGFPFPPFRTPKP
jgi:SAM-dependent methyltransferase